METYIYSLNLGAHRSLEAPSSDLSPMKQSFLLHPDSNQGLAPMFAQLSFLEFCLWSWNLNTSNVHLLIQVLLFETAEMCIILVLKWAHKPGGKEPMYKPGALGSRAIWKGGNEKHVADRGDEAGALLREKVAQWHSSGKGSEQEPLPECCRWWTDKGGDKRKNRTWVTLSVSFTVIRQADALRQKVPRLDIASAYLQSEPYLAGV